MEHGHLEASRQQSRMESDEARVNGLIAAGRFREAFDLAIQMDGGEPGTLAAHRSRAAVELSLGRLGEALHAIEAALAVAPDDRAAVVLRARILHKLGRSEEALGALRALVSESAEPSVEARMSLCEILHRLGRHGELQEVVREPRSADHPAMAIYRALATSAQDSVAAIGEFLAVVDDTGQQVRNRWVAGFHAVRLLDRSGRYEEAFALACRLHGAKARRWDVNALAADVSGQVDFVRRLADRRRFGTGAVRPAPPSLPVALISGLPRSGTTLLEQMLDRHPSVSGIGEYEGLPRARDILASTGLWPGELHAASLEAIRAAAQVYLNGAVARRRPGAKWIVEKSPQIWNSVPAVATALPGAACLHIVRDPRDCAISNFLSPMPVETLGWNQDLESIRRVIAMERSLLPDALTAFGIPHVSIVYEQLVAHPKAYMQECLRLMGLPWDDAVLEPQKNTRTVHTLSHEQVRKPINDSSIGRWKNYAFAFDSSWDGLVAAHEARSRAESARLAALESESAPGR